MLEYHYGILPEAAQAAYLRICNGGEQVPARPGSHVPAITGTLDDKQRTVMNSRHAVILEIRRRIQGMHISQRQAILSLIADFEKDGAMPVGCRLLEADLYTACKLANDRGRGLTRATVQRWISSFNDGGIQALAPGRPAQPGVEEAYPFIDDFLRFFAKPMKPSIRAALSDMEDARGAENAPSYGQVRRAIQALQATGRHIDLHRGREGYIALKARLAFTRRSTEGLDPGMVYIADGKTFDAEVAHPRHGRPFKPEITSIVDVATRVCVGYSIGLAESADVVADALRRSVSTWGICAVFYSDRGPGYRNLFMDGTYGLCSRLGITTTHSLPYNSQARGIIERFNGSVWNPLAQKLPTYLGREMDREASNAVHKKTRADIKERGASPLMIGFDEFVRLAGEAIDAYNHRPHSALRVRDRVTGRWIERSPIEAWEAARAEGFEPFTLAPNEDQDLYRQYEVRTVRRSEVRHNSNFYFAAELERYHEQRVLVGAEFDQADTVWIREIEERDGEIVPGRFICTAAYYGNRTSYMPRTMLEDAVERRARGRTQRAQAKIDEIEQERRQTLYIDDGKEVPLEIPDPASADVVPLRPVPAVPRQVLDPDVELMQRVLAGEEELHDGTHRILVDFYRISSSKRLLEHAGVDLDACRALLNSYTPKSKGER